MEEKCCKELVNKMDYQDIIDKDNERKIYDMLSDPFIDSFVSAYGKVGDYIEKEKTEPEKFADILKEMQDTFEKKNRDYGNSVSDTFDEFGLVSYVVRIADKYSRLKTLSKSKERLVKDESIRDTLMDMSCYCILAIKDLDRK